MAGCTLRLGERLDASEWSVVMKLMLDQVRERRLKDVEGEMGCKQGVGKFA